MESPEVFQPRLVGRCAAAGVAVAFVPELPNTGVSGATRRPGKDKALIQLSLRYKTDDHLWFTFFHEAGHILKHGKAVFLEASSNGLNDEREAEADAFAVGFLIPRAKFQAFAAQPRPTEAAIRKFAQNVGVAPGIVVGRLQHDGSLPYRSGCNRLKRCLRWATHRRHGADR